MILSNRSITQKKESKVQLSLDQTREIYGFYFMLFGRLLKFL